MYHLATLLIIAYSLGMTVFGQVPDAAGKVGVADFYLARDDGQGRAGEQVGGFSTDDTSIYCVVQLDSADPTTVKMNLVVVSVPGVKSGTRVVSTSYTTKNNQNRVNFSGRPVGRWLVGRYRVDIFVGNELAVSREFAVQKSAAPTPASESINEPSPGAKRKPIRRGRGT